MVNENRNENGNKNRNENGNDNENVQFDLKVHRWSYKLTKKRFF